MKARNPSVMKKLTALSGFNVARTICGHCRDVHHPKHRQSREIDEHDRPEERADPVGAAGLQGEQSDQDGDRDRHDPSLETADGRIGSPSIADSTDMAGVIIESP